MSRRRPGLQSLTRVGWAGVGLEEARDEASLRKASLRLRCGRAAPLLESPTSQPKSTSSDQEELDASGGWRHE